MNPAAVEEAKSMSRPPSATSAEQKPPEQQRPAPILCVDWVPHRAVIYAYVGQATNSL